MGNLRRIETSDVELGMFIHRLEGSWFSHPFWKRRFVIEDAADLAALHHSDVAGVIIDTEKGKDRADERTRDAPSPAAPAVASTRPARPDASARKAPAARPRPARQGPLPIAREFGAARRTAEQTSHLLSQAFLKARLGKGVAVGDVEPVVDEIYGTVQRNAQAFSALLRCQRDRGETYRHALAVCALMIALSRHLRLSVEEARAAGMAGLMMDVGVALLPNSLDAVDGDYRALPRHLLEEHILFGHDMLCVAGDIPEAVLEACRNHHERIDGRGYPRGLRGDAIDRLSRMAAVCDDFDYLVSGGFEREPLDPGAAVEAMIADSDGYDTEVLRAFIESVGVYPVGAFVRLRSEKLAMVVDIDPDNHALPVVRTFYSLANRKPCRGETIRLAQCWGADAIEGIADLSDVEIAGVETLQERLLKAACRG